MSRPAPRALDESEPPYDDPSRCPKTLTKTHRVDGCLYVAGRGPAVIEDSEIMFVTTSVQEEEAAEMHMSMMGAKIKQNAEYLRGPTAVVKDVAMRANLDIEANYFTALVKWLLPRATRNKPKTAVLQWGMPVLMDEISRVKPKIIVCMGKPVFDQLSDQKLSFKDAHGGWFWSEKAGAHLYLMHNPIMLVAKPEMFETFRIDFLEIRRKLDILQHGDINSLPVNIQVLRDEQGLRDWVAQMQEEGNWLYSVDCEWHGQTFLDLDLRSTQFAWSDTDGCYIRFRDSQNHWDFQFEESTMEDICDRVKKATGHHPDYAPDSDDWDQVFKRERYAAVGRILQPLMNKPEIRFIGHHTPADTPVINHWLGIEVYQKVIMDTEFAQQTVDEASELGLERGIAMKYTTLGRYNTDLILWKKENKKLCLDGYGFVPDEILIPYACLAWDSKVQLGDGSWEQIQKLVDSRYDGEVMALVGGVVKPCKVTNWKKTRKPGQKWFRIVTPTTRKNCKGPTGPRFTEDHKILTQRGYVRVDQLEPGTHRIATPYRNLNVCQHQLILGCLLGDGGLYGANDAGVGLRFSQSGPNIPYAQWKADSLIRAMDLTKRNNVFDDGRQPQLSVESSYHPSLKAIQEEYERSETSSRGHFKITEKILEDAGNLGLAVWAMDDGTRVDNTFRLCRRSAAPDEILAGLQFFSRRFGRGVRWSESNGVFIFSQGAFWRFMDAIKPYMHPAMARKHVEGEDITEPYPAHMGCTGVFYEDITEVIPADRGPASQKMDCFRYCLTVPEAGNFLTSVGFVSNCKDVIAPFRAYPLIRRQLEVQKLDVYYDTIINPFVSDVFANFTMVGLPMDIDQMDDMRVLMNYVSRELEAEFRIDMTARAKGLLIGWVMRDAGMQHVAEAAAIGEQALAGNFEEAWTRLKKLAPPDQILRYKALLEHLVECPNFKRTSSPQMRRWLFEVEGLTPIKSTNQKEAGLPSMAWAKVLELPKEVQKRYTPATDKQTLQILAEQLDLLDRVMDLSAVATICKSFLKEPDIVIDADGCETYDENGLHQWLASDGRVHGQWSLTETSRPRSWQPNSLNWPKFVNDRIALSVKRIIESRHASGILPPDLDKWVGKKPPSVRSCVMAPEGWVFVEDDFVSAEMFGLAAVSGDTKLEGILRNPDPEWALLKGGGTVRHRFASTEETGIPVSSQNEEFLMALWKDGKFIRKVEDDELVRDAEGNVVYASFDIHWSLAERSYRKCREMMQKDIERAAGKVANFSSAYGATGNSIERKIEADTGVKPEPGTGDSLLEAIAARQPRATQFLESMEEIPETTGYYRAASGRIRHCVIHDRNSGVGWRQRNSVISALGRELRNFPMQESVGATAARAGIWLMNIYRSMGLQARVVAILYDSVVSMCPLEERWVVRRMHEVYMSEQNAWVYEDEHGRRVLRYDIDQEFNYRWSTSPSKEAKAELEDPNWRPTPPHLKWLEGWMKDAPKVA